jgi:hypothetical protein
VPYGWIGELRVRSAVDDRADGYGIEVMPSWVGRRSAGLAADCLASGFSDGQIAEVAVGDDR